MSSTIKRPAILKETVLYDYATAVPNNDNKTYFLSESISNYQFICVYLKYNNAVIMCYTLPLEALMGTSSTCELREYGFLNSSVNGYIAIYRVDDLRINIHNDTSVSLYVKITGKIKA